MAKITLMPQQKEKLHSIFVLLELRVRDLLEEGKTASEAFELAIKEEQPFIAYDMQNSS